MKLIKIVESVNAFQKLAEIDLPIQTSFIVSDILFKIEDKINNYNQQKNKLIQKFGTTEDGINYNFTDDNKIKFIKELEELNNLDINLDVDKINLPNDIKVAPNILYNLYDFIERG